MADFSPSQVLAVAKLANITLSQDEAKKLAVDFAQTLSYIDNLQSINTSDVEPTHQVTNLENIFREDEINQDKMLSQGEALSGAKNTYQGYFVVDQLIEK